MSGELLDSEIVDEGDEDDVVVTNVCVDVDVDFTISKSNPYVLPPPLKHEVISRFDEEDLS